jgi:NTE family protein
MIVDFATSSMPVTLALSGGNALGAYQAGAYVALHARGIGIDRIVGASAGAINGALIAGNAPDDRIPRLTQFWQPASASLGSWMESLDTVRRTVASSWNLAVGRAGVFSPRSLIWQEFGDAFPSVYSTQGLAASLAKLVDMDQLNDGAMRYAATALDLESGEEVVFDTDAGAVTLDQIRASAALPPAFPSIEVDGRLYVDAGLSANLPLDPVLSAPPAGQSLCIAIDLLPLAAPRPRTLGGMASRAQDLMFAAQSRRSLAAWETIMASRAAAGDMTAVTLIHLQYADQVQEVAGKAFDFSIETIKRRWQAGARDMDGVLDRLNAGTIPFGRPGLTIETVAQRPAAVDTIRGA